MGNCLVIERSREIKVMSVVDGGIVVKALPPGPSKVGVVPCPRRPQHVQDPAADVGQLRRLLPGPGTKAPADPAGAGAADAAVRVKLVISKQELRRMMGKNGVSLDDMVALMRREAPEEETSCCRPAGWRPALHSIPEGTDFCFYD